MSVRQSIKLQMLIASALVIGLVIAFASINHYYKSLESDLRDLQVSISDSESMMLEIRRQEKDFISRVDLKYIQSATQNIETLKSDLQKIQHYLDKYNFETLFSTTQIQSAIDNYSQTLYQLARQKILIEGQNKTGLIETVKDSWFNLERVLLAQGGEKYHETLINLQESTYYFFRNFSNEHLTLIQQHLVKLSLLSSGDNEVIRDAILNYQNTFTQLQQAYQHFGYDHNSGLHGSLRAEIHNVENKLESLHKIVPVQIEQKLNVLDNELHVILSALVITLGIIMTYATWSIAQLEKRLLCSENKARNSNKAKSAFLANMSHEIRTPLNGIIGMSQIMSDTHLSPSQRDYLGTIETSSQTLLMLINDILDLSKIESGHIEITPYPSHVREAIFDIASMVAGKTTEKGLSLNIDIADDTPYSVEIDEHRLRQILMNLMSNAVKFTKQGSITISVTTKFTADRTELTFSVQDSGIGIDKDKQASIFEPFKQEDGSITREFGGTGLGLSISTQLVKLMGGILQVESEKDQGSRFYFTLPVNVLERTPRNHNIAVTHACIVCCDEHVANQVANNLAFHGVKRTTVVQDISHTITSDVIFLYHNVADETKKQIAQLERLAPNTPLILIQRLEASDADFNDTIDGLISFPILGSRVMSTIQQSKEALYERKLHQADPDTTINRPDADAKQQVLIVEDNNVNQQVVSLFLRKANYQFDIAHNGLEALNKVKQGKRYQIMLMDCMMPEMDGFTATQEIRKFEQKNNLPSTPIVALTASVLDQDIKKCLEVGMDDYLSKPLKKDKLYAMLDKHT
ncbi:hybrid sensor histidine kinase/response regulator [Vibrio intestinalis]|uniref:hybrid sensor histidine kinase/response regulator n=1 Tax=Vibrio intestinalis TaxID=2933291 RepID=UPI00242E9330|nr:ATP-binding protein [Vibrio intestinalis]